MGGSYFNDNITFVNGYQFISYSAASEQSAALDPSTRAVELLASTDCYVCIDVNPTAAAPSGEKVKTASFKLVNGVEKTVGIPMNASPIKIAVIRLSADGILEICERRF